MKQRAVFWGKFESEWGWVSLGIFEDKVAWLSFLGASNEEIFPLREFWGQVEEQPELVSPFFEKVFSPEIALPVLLLGTPFQVSVWEALRAIPLGETVTYGELARRIGRPDAARAVGSAVGANRIGYQVPCHRVIRGDGRISEFRWGADLKRRLLERESSLVEMKREPEVARPT